MTLDRAEQDRVFALVAAMITVANNKELSDYFVEIMTTREHRTNQQMFFKRIPFALMNVYKNKQPGQYDARNEDTVNFCRRIEDALDTTGFSYI